MPTALTLPPPFLLWQPGRIKYLSPHVLTLLAPPCRFIHAFRINKSMEIPCDEQDFVDAFTALGGNVSSGGQL